MHTGGGNIFAYPQLVCRTGQRKFCAIRDLRVFCFLVGKQDHHVLLHRERGEKFPLPFFVVARLVNLQECRIKRDPLFIDRSSTKPCGRSRNGTRTCLPSAPVPMDLFGKVYMHNDRMSFTAHRGLSELWRRIRSRSVKSTRERKQIQLLLICVFIELVFFFRVKDPLGSLAFCMWVGISFVFV